MLLQLAIVIFQTTLHIFAKNSKNIVLRSPPWNLAETMGSSDKYVVFWRSNVKMAEAREEALDISFQEMSLEGKYSSSMSSFCLLSLLAAFRLLNFGL